VTRSKQQNPHKSCW